MKEFTVITTREIGTEWRVVRKDFDLWDDALEYANEISDNIRTVRCSIFRHTEDGTFLVMDVI